MCIPLAHLILQSDTSLNLIRCNELCTLSSSTGWAPREFGERILRRWREVRIGCEQRTQPLARLLSRLCRGCLRSLQGAPRLITLLLRNVALRGHRY
eukprot:1060890-Prymnesium_polylepis.2